MRGIISPKLVPFLEQANTAIAAAKAIGQGFSVELVRQSLGNLSALIGSGPHMSVIKDTFLETSSHNIPIRIYNPSPDDVLPVLLHFHGGGHMCGNADLYDPISRKLALVTQSIVICADYRLAPEYPYPAGLEDCQQVLLHYRSLLAEMKYSDELYIAGDSAGGAICTSLVMNNLDSDLTNKEANKETNRPINIAKQILIYPSVDYTMVSASIDENGQGFLLEKDKIHWYFEQYFQEGSLEQGEVVQAKIAQASPLLGKFSANMPTTLVITAGCDPLRDEGVAYAKSLAEVGVSVEHHSFDGMIHAYMLLNELAPEECQQTYQLIGKFIKADD